MKTIVIRSIDEATSSDIVSSHILTVKRSGQIYFDRLAILAEAYNALITSSSNNDLLQGIFTAQQYIGIDYRNLNLIVKINKNINSKLLGYIKCRKPVPYKYINITAKVALFGDVTYVIVVDISLDMRISTHIGKNLPKIVSLYDRPYINAKVLPTPSIAYLYKVVNSKFKATESCLKLQDKIVLTTKCEKESISIVPVTKTIEDVVESIKAALLEGHTISSLIHGKLCTVRDIGICNMNTPMVIVKLKDNTFENLLIEQHTATSIGNMFTKEVKMSFA